MNLEAPNELPVNLSHSSIELFLKCQTKWRNRYILNQYESPVGIQVLGRAVHAAEAQSYHHQVASGQPHSLEQVLDDFTTTLENEEQQEDVDWQDETPGTTKDRGVKMLSHYHRVIPYNMKPTTVEAKFELKLKPEYKWTVRGYIDIVGGLTSTLSGETLTGVHDLKTVKKKIAHVDLEASQQATLYTYAMMNEREDELPFLVHEIKSTESRVVHTVRSRAAGERYMEQIASIARQIERNMQTGDWAGAPASAWWCRATACGYFESCPLATRP